MKQFLRRSPELWLIMPVFMFMAVFYAYPLLNMLAGSFEGDEGGFTLAEYRAIFDSDLYLRVFLRSLEISFWVTLISLLISYPFAYFAVYSKYTLLLFGVVAMSMWLGIIIRSYGWMGVLGDGGVLNYFIGFLTEDTSTWLYNRSAVVIGMVHILMPYMVLPLFAVMRSIPDNVLMASKSLGARNFYTFLKIYVPLSMPGILAGCLLVFIQSIGFYVTPALIGGRSEVMIAQLIELQVRDLLNWPFASALAATLLVITAVSLLICSRFVPLKLLWGGR
ncbi:ABC transporter permease [Nesterenkonia salmonea]|uniref:ABC transporter permease n=1 Tax=Nesterenkonia salmonea TaxID=1804987 RepID=A0A5R9BKC7_9MICC|nr:ABC transporter permease [Nesterenkonia salmonea]TLQ01059.1 ABC transporter permease [Nesterenkonia salmonea]